MMNMDKNRLNKQDVINLSQAPKKVENKMVVAQKIASFYNSAKIQNKLKNIEASLAEDIFRILIKDVELKVRQTLAESLKNSRNLPKDIVNSLLKETASISLPFIKYYQDLTSEDLKKIIDLSNIHQQKAVAGRLNLPEEISQYIVDKCPSEVVGVLISNETAEIKEETYNNILQKYFHDEDIKRRLVYRSELPVSIIEKMAHSLSEELKKRLILTHNIPINLATDIIEEVKEKTTLKISEEFSSDKQIEELVHQLYSANRLTPNMIVRSICLGDLKFFEYALVYLSNTPIIEVRKILFNTSADFMVRNLLRKAYIPKTLFPAVFTALKVIKDIHFDCRKDNRKAFGHKVIERILTNNYNSDELNEEDIKYLISKIS